MTKNAPAPEREAKPTKSSPSYARFTVLPILLWFTPEPTSRTVGQEGNPLTREQFLIQQGEAIASALRQRGYLVKPAVAQTAWEVTKPGEDWWLLLTFIPRPIEQWRFLPAHPEHQSHLYDIVEQAIGGRR
jgi:hypothetical protein